MIKLFICKVCGEPYLGEEAPSDCPFCGAPGVFVVLFSDYKQLWKTAISETEKADMNAALADEVNATYFYDKVAKTQERYSKYNRLFKRLTTVEQEHIDILVKFLQITTPVLKGEESKGSIEKDLVRTAELEEGATKDYVKFAARATNENVRMLFKALEHAERGHYDLVNNDKK